MRINPYSNSSRYTFGNSYEGIERLDKLMDTAETMLLRLKFAAANSSRLSAKDGPVYTTLAEHSIPSEAMNGAYLDSQNMSYTPYIKEEIRDRFLKN